MAKQLFVCEKCKTAYLSRTQATTCEDSHCAYVGDVADTLHRWMCQWNHTDGCGYHYEKETNPGQERKPWLAKAEQVLAFAKMSKIDVRTLMIFLRTIVKD